MKWKSFFVLIFLALPLFLQWKSISNKVQDIDEIAWPLDTSYYHHVLEGDFAHPDWKTEEALDHPPLLKYFFGVLLHTQGIRVENNLPLIWWKEAFAHGLNTEDIKAKGLQIIPLQAILFLRAVMLALTLGTCFLWYLLCKKLWGEKIAILAMLLLLWNPLFSFFSLQVLSELFLFLGITVFLWFCLHWVNLLQNNFHLSKRMLFIGGALFGLVLSIKFTLLVLIPFFILLAVWFCVVFPKQRLKIIISSLTVLFFAICTFIGLNPSMWHSSMELLQQSANFRAELLAVQRTLYHDAFHPWYGSVVNFFRIMWLSTEGSFFAPLRWMGILQVSGFVFFAACFLGQRQNNELNLQKKKIFIGIGLLVVLLSFFQFGKVSYSRYLYLVWPWLSVAVAHGFLYFQGMVQRAESRNLIFPLSLMCCFLVASWTASRASWFYKEQEIFFKAPAEIQLFFSQRFLQHATALDGGVAAYMAFLQGDIQQAELFARATLFLHPHDHFSTWILKHLHKDVGGPEKFMAQFNDLGGM